MSLITQSQDDTANPSSPVCFCDNPPRLGLSIGYWEPVRLVDVTRTPFCMRERFNAVAPIVIDVKSLATLTEPGCKRLEVTTRQEGVREAANHPPARKELVYQVSYCRDGRFPDTK